MYHHDMVAVLISPQVSTRLRRKNVDCNYMYHHDFRIDFSAGESEKDALPFVHDFFIVVYLSINDCRAVL